MVNLALDVSNSTDQLHGSVQSSNWTAKLIGDRVLWTTNTLAEASQFTNHYTVAIPGVTNVNEGPIGWTYGFGLVDQLGRVTLTGASGDGQRLSQKTFLSKSGDWPFYVSLYPEKRIVPDLLPPKTNIEYQGALLGWLHIATNATIEDRPSPFGTVSWIKRGWTNNLYPNGFTNGTSINGSTYLAPLSGSRAIDITNAQLTVSGGNLAHPLTNYLTLQTNNVFSIKAPFTNGLKISLAPKNGMVQGSFTTSQSTNRFQGIILQHQRFGRGWFLGTNEGGALQIDAN